MNNLVYVDDRKIVMSTAAVIDENLHSFNIIGVMLQFGSDSELEPGEVPTKMSFPFRFKGTFSYNGNRYEVTECADLKIDTDVFYA